MIPNGRASGPRSLRSKPRLLHGHASEVGDGANPLVPDEFELLGVSRVAVLGLHETVVVGEADHGVQEDGAGDDGELGEARIVPDQTPEAVRSALLIPDGASDDFGQSRWA